MTGITQSRMRAYATAESGAPMMEKQLTKKQATKAAKKAAKAEKKLVNAKAKAKNQELADKRSLLKGLKSKSKKKGGGSRLFGSLASGLGKICKKMNPLKVSRSSTESQLKISHGRRFSQGGSAGRLLGSAAELKGLKKKQRSSQPQLQQSGEQPGQRRTSGMLSHRKSEHAPVEAKGTKASGLAMVAGNDDRRAVSKPRTKRSSSTDALDLGGSGHPARLKSSSRSASQPVLVKMIPTFVNRFKACPLSLGEKLARWCRASPMAIFKQHPPEDHFVQFPPCEYSDHLAERKVELAAAGHACELEYDPAKRDECVLKRYPDGRHGLKPFDMSLRPAANPKALKTPKLPPPRFPTSLAKLGRGESSPELKSRARKERDAHRQMPTSAAGTNSNSNSNSNSSGAKPVAAPRRNTPPMLRRGTSDSIDAAQGTCLDLGARLGSSWDLSGRTAHIPEQIEELPESLSA